MKFPMIKIGFIGLGLMGEPMARNLATAGHALVVWNRSPEKCRPFKELNCMVAGSAAEVFEQSDVVILMLASEQATDITLDRHSKQFQRMVREKLVVQMGTTRPEYSRDLGDAIQRAGGSYVECPVSGSRKPAENAELVAMIAGSREDVRFMKPIVRTMCNAIFECGSVPDALNMKLAVNLFLITMVTGLVESFHFAQAKGLNLETFRAVSDAGPMASKVSTVKLEKLVAADYAPQAAIEDVLKNCKLVFEAARSAGAASPLLDACCELFKSTKTLGHGALDMVAVLRAVEELAQASRAPA